jgi:hypothetical protein
MDLESRGRVTRRPPAGLLGRSPSDIPDTPDSRLFVLSLVTIDRLRLTGRRSGTEPG